MIAVQLKKSVNSVGVFCIILDKFSYWKGSCPVVLPQVNNDLEVSFYVAILPFGLIICLKVEYSREFLLDT